MFDPAFYRLGKMLVQIAGGEGAPHALDTSDERERAIDELASYIYSGSVRTGNGAAGDSFGLVLAKYALGELMHSPDNWSFQVNPILRERDNCVECTIVLPGDDSDGEFFSLLTALPSQIYAAFYVYYAEPGDQGNFDIADRQEKVYVTRKMWEEMVGPMRLYHDVSEAACLGERGCMERGELAQVAESIGLFERTIGLLAATGGDGGGWSGNRSIFDPSRPRLSRQQQCIHDARTAAQFGHMLHIHGHLTMHVHDDDDSFVSLPTHIAYKMRSAVDGQDRIVDTWLRDNGVTPPTYADLHVWIQDVRSAR